VPSCPGTVVTDVRWIGFPDLDTAIWTIELVDALDTTPTAFTAGEPPPGYETRVALTTPATDVLAQARDATFVALRADAGGRAKPYAAAEASLAELRPGMIRFDPEGPAPARLVASIGAYEAAVGCSKRGEPSRGALGAATWMPASVRRF